MNTAEVESQAYNVTIAQGKILLQLLTHMEKIMEAVGKPGIGPVESAVLLELSRACSNVGGRPS